MNCEYPDCELTAVCAVEAQWTLVDFVSYRACDEHADLMLEILAQRYVDGQPPVDVWTHRWE